MAVTPAGAEVSQAVATNWKKIWKKNLKPLADRRYYTKAQSDTKYQPKGSYETAGSGYTKAESDAKYAGAGSSYSKADSDGRYEAAEPTKRGLFDLFDPSVPADGFIADDIMFGTTLATAPAVTVVNPGAAAPAQCAGGTVALPQANPGNLCIFLQLNSGGTFRVMDATLSSASNNASRYGAYINIRNDGTAGVEIWGSWAVR